MENPLPFIDLIPHRKRRLILFFMAAVVVVALLEALYLWSFEFKGLTTDGSVAALDLDSEGTLAVWFSSVTLLAAGGYAFIIYRLRCEQLARAEEEEEGGRADVASMPWLLAALCWTMMSLDETGSLHEGFKELMTRVTGTSLYGDGSLWWAIPYCLVLVGIGSRLLVDMWPRMMPTLTFLIAAGFYVLAVVAQLGMILPTADPIAIMIEEGAEMLGNLAILATMLLQSRIVTMELGGELAYEYEEEEYEEEYEEEEVEEEDEEEPQPKRRWWQRRKKEVAEEEEVEEEEEEEVVETKPSRTSKSTSQSSKSTSRTSKKRTVHTRHETPKAPAASTTTTSKKNTSGNRNQNNSGNNDGGQDNEKKMTRAEKKRLRKRLMAERSQREGRS